MRYQAEAIDPRRPSPELVSLIVDAKACGAEIIEAGRMFTSQGWIPLAKFLFPDGWSTARFLIRRSIRDVSDPKIQALAQRFLERYPVKAERAAAIHAFVRDRVKFTREKKETFQRAAFTLFDSHAGDCDDSARAAYAVALAAGIVPRMGFLTVDGQPAHVYAEFFHDGAWHPAETTIRARYDEDPRDAAARLGVRMRPDLESSEVVHLAALPPSSMTPIGHDLTTLKGTWIVQPQTIVRLALEVPGYNVPAGVAQSLTDLGFTKVEATDNTSDLSLDWPQDWRVGNLHTETGRIVFAQAAWAQPNPQTFKLVDDEWTVRGAIGLDTLTPPIHDLPSAATATPGTVAPTTPIPAEPSNGSRSVWARAVLAHAWPTVYPSRALSEAAADALLAVAALETLIGAGWLPWVAQHPEAAGLQWNFGAVHCNSVPDPSGKCPAGCTPHLDQNVPSCFRVYASAVDGMADFVKTSTHGGALLAFESGDPETIARAMAANHYYGSNPPTEAEIQNYAAAIRSQLGIVRQRLASGGASTWQSALALVLGGAAAGAGAWAWHYYRRRRAA